MPVMGRACFVILWESMNRECWKLKRRYTGRMGRMLRGSREGERNRQRILGAGQKSGTFSGRAEKDVAAKRMGTAAT